jgi:hypothetical protein
MSMGQAVSVSHWRLRVAHRLQYVTDVEWLWAKLAEVCLGPVKGGRDTKLLQVLQGSKPTGHTRDIRALTQNWPNKNDTNSSGGCHAVPATLVTHQCMPGS